jgi:hypothetical protein
MPARHADAAEESTLLKFNRNKSSKKQFIQVARTRSEERIGFGGRGRVEKGSGRKRGQWCGCTVA